MNEIHPTALVHHLTVMGDGNYIGPYCMIGPCVEIGDGNRFEAYVSIGAPAEKSGYFTRSGITKIGDRNVFREFVTVNAGTTRETRIGDDCILLRGCHVGHDSLVCSQVTISCDVLVGGESTVGRGANLGLGAVLHQYSIVPQFAMLGMGAVLTKRCRMKPGEVWVGNPAHFLKVNEVGMKRFGITEEMLT